MFRVLLCDDNMDFLQMEKNVLLEIFQEEAIIAEIEILRNSEELIALGEKINEFHLLLIDVEMGEKNGIMAVSEMRKYSDIPVAFVSTFIDYAIEGYKVHAVRYILKQPEGLKAAIRECIVEIYNSLNETKYVKQVVLPCREECIQITSDNFVYAESKLHYVYIYTYSDSMIKKYSIRVILDDLEHRLSFLDVIRIHKSHLVNAAYIEYIKRYEVKMRVGTLLPISQGKYDSARKEYAKYLGEKM